MCSVDRLHFKHWHCNQKFLKLIMPNYWFVAVKRFSQLHGLSHAQPRCRISTEANRVNELRVIFNLELIIQICGIPLPKGNIFLVIQLIMKIGSAHNTFSHSINTVRWPLTAINIIYYKMITHIWALNRNMQNRRGEQWSYLNRNKS